MRPRGSGLDEIQAMLYDDSDGADGPHLQPEIQVHISVHTCVFSENIVCTVYDIVCTLDNNRVCF